MTILLEVLSEEIQNSDQSLFISQKLYQETWNIQIFYKE